MFCIVSELKHPPWPWDQSLQRIRRIIVPVDIPQEKLPNTAIQQTQTSPSDNLGPIKKASQGKKDAWKFSHFRSRPIDNFSLKCLLVSVNNIPCSFDRIDVKNIQN